MREIKKVLQEARKRYGLNPESVNKLDGTQLMFILINRVDNAAYYSKLQYFIKDIYGFLVETLSCDGQKKYEKDKNHPFIGYMKSGDTLYEHFTKMDFTEIRDKLKVAQPEVTMTEELAYEIAGIPVGSDVAVLDKREQELNRAFAVLRELYEKKKTSVPMPQFRR